MIRLDTCNRSVSTAVHSMRRANSESGNGLFSGDSSRVRYACLTIIFLAGALFILLNLRHLAEPFRDYGKPFAGEPFYAVRALNYLRHGYFSNWLGVCDNLNPAPDNLVFKFTEMPAYFIVQSLGFRLFGVTTLSFRMVELAYAAALFSLVCVGAWRLFDHRTAALSSILMLLLPVNMFLLYTAWVFLFPTAAVLAYTLWSNSESKAHCYLVVLAVALGCLHHIVGYLAAPVILIHALVTGTWKRHRTALCVIVGSCLLVGLGYVTQILLLRQNPEALGSKALAESVFNISYIRGFFSINVRKLIPNYRELLTIPVLVLSTFWILGTIFWKNNRGSGDSFLFMVLLLPALFFLIFLGMVGSHLHFLTLFSPFLAVSCARALVEPKTATAKERWLTLFLAVLLTAYLAFMSYKTQRKYDLMVWQPENQRGYALATSLSGFLGESESVGGVNDFGYGYGAMSPAFYFYLGRNYYGGISSLERLREAIEEEGISLFVFSEALAGEGRERSEMRDYLFENSLFFTDPSRPDTIIFDLRTSQKNSRTDKKGASRTSSGQPAPQHN